MEILLANMFEKNTDRPSTDLFIANVIIMALARGKNKRKTGENNNQLRVDGFIILREMSSCFVFDGQN